MNKKVFQNIRKLYWFNFFMMFLTIIPVLVPFWQQNGMNMRDVYLLPAIYSTLLILLDVPAGYLSDLWGRKKTLILAAVFNGLSFLTLALSKHFFGFAVFEALSAIAVSLASGCDVALIYDSLDEAQASASSREILGTRFYFSQIGETLASIIGGLLALSSLLLPAMVNAVVAWIPLLIACSLVEPQSRARPNKARHWDNFSELVSTLLIRTPKLRKVIFFHLFFGFATFSAVWSLQGFWQSVGIPTYYFGFLWALLNLTGAVAGKKTLQIESVTGERWLFAVVALLPVLGYCGMALVPQIRSTSFVTVLLAGFFALLFPVCRALNYVVVQDSINVQIGNEMRATANSFISVGVRGLSSLFGPWVGHLIDRQGYSANYLVLGGLCALFLGLTLIDRSRQVCQTTLNQKEPVCSEVT